jgi:uncharacterized iron-regulated membrane protein
LNRHDTFAGSPTGKQKSARRKLFDLHSWVGFHLALLMTIIIATGTIATVSNEIDWVFQHDMRVTPDGSQVSWQVIEDAARSFDPEGRIINLEVMPGDHFAYRARMTSAQGQQYFLHINQWTGEVTGTTHPMTVQRIFRDLHRYLFMPNFIGLPLVTAFAFVLAISLYTGLRTTRNWKTIATRIRFSKGTRTAIGDAHKAYGIWAIWFFLVMIVTSVWYLAEFGAGVAGSWFEPERPKLEAARVEAFGDIIRDRGAGDIIDAAAAAYPELKPTQILYPFTARDPVTVLGTTGNPFLRDRANRVFLDPVTLEALKVQRASDIGALAWVNELADPLHFGYFGGLPSKLVWFLFGLGMTGLSLSGVWLTWKRLKTTAVSRAQFATFPVLLISFAFATGWYDRLHGPSLPDSERLCSDLQMGASRVTVYLEAEEEAALPAAVRVAVSAPDGRPNIQTVSVSAYGTDARIIWQETLRPAVAGQTVIARHKLAAERLDGVEGLDVTVAFPGKTLAPARCREI